MPELIGAALVTALASSATAATVVVGTVTVGAIVGDAVVLGATLGLSLLLNSNQTQKVASQQFSSRQPLPPRQRGYGRFVVAGPKFVFDSAGGKFFDGYYHCEGPIDAIEEWQLDDQLTTIAFPGGIAGIAPWQNQVTVQSRLGAAGETALVGLDALTYWTPEHRLDGCAKSLVTSTAPAEKNFQKFFPSSRWPDLRVKMRAAKVRDVRDPAQTTDPATWVWSDRAGPCLYDFLTHPVWGMAVPDALMNLASWQAFNGLCDQTITDKSGASFPRYYLGGLYQMTDDPADTVQAMLDTCDGRLTLEPDGTIGITGGQTPAPTVSLVDPHVISMTLEVGSGKLAAFNRLKGTFVSPANDYQQIPGDPWIDAAAQAYAGETLEQQFDRPWIQNHNQLRRLSKIYTAKGNPDFRITNMVTDMSGAPALFEDAIDLTLSEYGISGVFLVTRAVANIEAGTCTFDMISLRPGTYDFDPATEEGQTPAIAGAQAVAAVPDRPVNLVASIERRAVSGGTVATFLRLTCAALDRADLSLIGQYRQQGAADWTSMAQDSDDPASLISSVLADGATYEAQGAIATYGRAQQSAWTATDPQFITATADTTSPGAPTGFVANGGAGAATLAFTAPNAGNFGSAKVYRGGSSAAFAAAVVIATFNGSPSQSFDMTDSGLQPGAYQYWVRAFNRSGYPSATSDASSTAGPISATVS